MTRPPTDFERQHYTAALHWAVTAGLIDLDDFERRITEVMKAGTLDEIEQTLGGIPAQPPRLELPGWDGTARLERDRLVLEFRAGMRTQDIKEARSPRVIPLTAIASVEHAPKRFIRIKLVGEAPWYKPRGPSYDANALLLSGRVESWADTFVAELRQRIAFEPRTADPTLLPAQARLPGLPPPPPGELFVQFGTSEAVVTLDENGVLIEFRAGRKRNTRRWLPLTAIAAVELIPTRTMRRGYLKFVLAGTPAGHRRPDSVALFTGKQEGVAEDLAAHVAARITGPRVVEPHLLPGNQPAPPAAPAATAPAQLRELARLRAEGIITDADYEAKKRQILDRW